MSLGVTVSTLFPGSARALNVLKKQREAKPRLLPSDETYTRVAATGLEVDPALWFFRIQLRGQIDVIDFPVEPDEKRRLFGLVQSQSNDDDAPSFIVFDSANERVGLNLAHLLYCHFRYEVRKADSNEDQESDDSVAMAYFVDRSVPVEFAVDTARNAEDDSGLFGAVLFELDAQQLVRGQRIYFEDGEGEDVFVRAEDLAMLRVPLWVVDPEVLNDDEEEAEG